MNITLLTLSNTCPIKLWKREGKRDRLEEKKKLGSKLWGKISKKVACQSVTKQMSKDDSLARVQASIYLSFLIKYQSKTKEREDCRSIEETGRCQRRSNSLFNEKNKNVRFVISQPILGRSRRKKTQWQWKRHYLALFKTIFGICLRHDLR